MHECAIFKSGTVKRRYEVTALDGDGKEFVVGWTDNSDGSPLVDGVNLHPSWNTPKIIDRKTDDVS